MWRTIDETGSWEGEIWNRRKSGMIVQTIIQMGHNLGMTLVAEGVETKDQARILREYGCDLAQGYPFSKPLPFEDFERLLCAGPLID